MVDFSANGVKPALAAAVTETFNVEMFRTEQFKVIERSQLQKVIDEQNLQLSGMTDSDYAKVGALVGADFILVGSVSVLGSKYIINARVVQVSTGNVVKAENGSVFDVEEIDELTRDIANRLAGVIRDEFRFSSGRSYTFQGSVPVPPDRKEKTKTLQRFNFFGTAWTPVDGNSLYLASLSLDSKLSGPVWLGGELGYQYQINPSTNGDVETQAFVAMGRFALRYAIGSFELVGEFGAGFVLGSIAYLGVPQFSGGLSGMARAGVAWNFKPFVIGVYGTLYGEVIHAYSAFYPMGAGTVSMSLGMEL